MKNDEEYESLIEKISDDKNLTIKQKAWLCAFFGDGDTKFKVRESCEAARCHYMSCYYWRNEPRYDIFQDYFNLFQDMIVAEAEQGLYNQVRSGYWPAQQFALTKLSKKYGDKIDITSGGQPITSITITPITPEDVKREDNGGA